MGTFNAIIDLTQDVYTATAVKQAALLFDHVAYIPPLGFTISKDVFKRYKKVSEKHGYIEGFSWFKDIAPGVSIADESLQCDVLKETIKCFRKAGIISPARYAPGVTWKSGRCTEDIRHAIGTQDLSDQFFLDNSGSTQDILTGKIDIIPVGLKNRKGVYEEILWVNVCSAVAVSWGLTELADVASQNDASPLICRPLDAVLLSRRISRYINAIDNRQIPSPIVKEMANASRGAGELIAQIEALFPSDTVSEMSPSDIISARKSFDDARRDLLARYFIELDELLLEGDEESHRQRVQRFKHDKLRPALIKFNQEQKEFREQWIGRAITRTTSALSNASIGSGIGYIVGQTMPIGGLSAIFLLGVLGGLVKDAPAAVKDLMEYLVAYRRLRRTSISYINRING